jgi:retron-type reverse transcriptase
MPKRHGNLYEQMFTLDALHAAYLRSRDRKRKKSAVRRFEQNLGFNLQALHNELQAGTYEPRPYKTFYVYEPKPRLIHAPHFRDVVVQQAMYAVLYPLVDSRLCFESYGCRKNKGTHRAADRAQQFLRESPPDSYLLQLDIRKFFYRIDRETLLSQWRKIVKDTRVLHLLHEFSLYPADAGVPIGNLMSQIAALIYLNPLDHYIKRTLKAGRYVRYVDDFIVFGLTKPETLAMREQITDWLKANLGLELSRWTIQPVSRGLNFVGFRTWRKTRFVRKHSLYTFNRALRTGAMDSIVSCIGHAKASATHKHFMNRLREYPELYAQLPEPMKRGQP